jgi:hypothetical protein
MKGYGQHAIGNKKVLYGTDVADLAGFGLLIGFSYAALCK